jgi:hypothetical protein
MSDRKPAEDMPLAAWIEGHFPPLEPELEALWEQEARSFLKDPTSQEPECLAYVLGLVHGRRIKEWERRRAQNGPGGE